MDEEIRTRGRSRLRGDGDGGMFLEERNVADGGRGKILVADAGSLKMKETAGGEVRLLKEFEDCYWRSQTAERVECCYWRRQIAV